MAKSAKTKKIVKVKKVRTPEEKAARKIRRKEKRDSRKIVHELKERIEAAKSNVEVIAAAAVLTSDGLPFSKSVDNPESLLGMLAAEAADKKVLTISAEIKALAKFREKKFAPSAVEHILAVESL